MKNLRRILPILQALPKHLLALQRNLVHPVHPQLWQSSQGAPTDTSKHPGAQPKHLPQQFNYMPTLLTANKEWAVFCLIQSQNVNNILQESRTQYIHVKLK